MVVPVATAQQLTRSFRTTLRLAMVLGVGRVARRLVLAAFAPYARRSPPGATIVLLALAGFVARLAGRRAGCGAGAAAHARSRPTTRWAHDDRRAPATSTATTAATRRSPHGDHVDYVHDGHRHAATGAHYDEH